MSATELGRACVRAHDEQGLHVSFAFARLASRGQAPSLLGALAEAARRNMGRPALREIAEEFCNFFPPTPAEAAACRLLGARPTPGPPGTAAPPATR